MSMAVILTNEQREIVEKCGKFAQKFTENPALLGSVSAIDHARALIEEAYAAKIPEQATSGLRIYVAMHEQNLMAPEHLRQFKPLP
ncbi:hypothetical protein [uncultured Sphingosinicella sp.]|uniref:hypothetical protein n=1 Tax=uncultured Sphingosinicella sp. TaxID=478748 RepID=UPI0030DC5449|tara:strand:- start:22098 stop:22355 length:258 start_codon:yes stop_codon:yes gene_type:complete